MAIRVAIVEDQRIVREILEAQLARETDMHIIGAAGTGREAIQMVSAVRPEVLLLDLVLPDMSGLDVAHAVRGQHSHVKIIVLSIHTEPDVVRRTLAAGVNGYVAKSGVMRDLLVAIRTVARGDAYISDGLASLHHARHGAGLGRRERQVLAMIAEGCRSHEIALRLDITVATVESHRRNIMRKLGLHSVAALTKFAVRAGLTSLS